MLNYEIVLYWSAEDGVFIAEVPELAGCAAHGVTQEAALASVKEAMQLWIDTAAGVRRSDSRAQRASAHAGVTGSRTTSVRRLS